MPYYWYDVIAQFVALLRYVVGFVVSYGGRLAIESRGRHHTGTFGRHEPRPVGYVPRHITGVSVSVLVGGAA